MYFLGGYAMMFLREFFYDNYKHNYDFSGLAIKIFGVPPVIPLGWLFTFYIGLCFGEKIFGFTCQDIAAELRGADPAKAKMIWEKKLIPLLINVAVFTGTVCYAIESCAINMGWWRFVGYAGEYVANPIQYMWSQTAIIFTTIFFLAYFKEVRLRKNWLFAVVFTAKYVAEDFVYQYLDPFWVAVLWILILVLPILFYEEFSVYYMILLFGGRLFVDIFLIETPENVLILKLVFFVPQAIYYLGHLYPGYALGKYRRRRFKFRRPAENKA